MLFKFSLFKSAALLLLILHAAIAHSADANVPRGIGVKEKDRRDYNPRGVHLGGFTLFPKLDLENEYNSNIFYNEIIERDDYIFHLKPSFNLQSNWSRHSLNLSVESDIAYHATFDTEDWQDYRINLDGALDILRDSFATARFYQSRTHQSRGDPDDNAGLTPTDLHTIGGKAAYQYKLNRIRLTASNETFHLNYEDNINAITGEVIPNELRDRLKNISIFRTGYEITPSYEAFIEGEYNFINYDSTFDENGLARSSTGYQVVAGIALDFTGLLTGKAYFGYLEQDYDDPRLETLSEITGGFSLEWSPTGLTTVIASLDRVPRETTQGFASGYLDTAVKFSVDHELLRNILLNINTGYANQQYTGASFPGQPVRDDNLYQVGINAKYLFTRSFYLKGGYQFSNRSSNVPLGNYNVSRVYMTIGTQI